MKEPKIPNSLKDSDIYTTAEPNRTFASQTRNSAKARTELLEQLELILRYGSVQQRRGVAFVVGVAAEQVAWKLDRKHKRTTAVRRRVH